MSATKVQLINGGFQDAEGNVLANGYLKMKLSQDETASGVGQVAGGIEVQVTLDSNGNVLGTPSPFTLSAVAVAAGVATYTGTITGGGNNAYSGVSFVIAGFVQGGNNGTFTCTGSTTTTLTFAATTQVNETHAGTATGGVQNIWPNDQLTPTNSFYFVKGYKSDGQLCWGPNAQQVTGTSPFDCNTWTPNFLPNFSPATTALSLQTNETANGSQSLLDLHAGSGVTLTDNGSGRVTIATSGGITLQTNGTPNGSQSKLNLVSGSNVAITDDGVGDVTVALASPNTLLLVKNRMFMYPSGVSASNISLAVNGFFGFAAPLLFGSAGVTFVAATASTLPSYKLSHPLGGNSYCALSCCGIGNGAANCAQYSFSGGNLNAVKFSVLLNQTTNCRVWIGLTDSNSAFNTALATDNPAQNMTAFRYSAATDTHWKAYTSTDATHFTAGDTGIAPDTNYHDFMMIWNGAGVDFYIDNVKVVSNQTTNMPSNTTLMGDVVGINSTNGAQQSCQVAFVLVRQN